MQQVMQLINSAASATNSKANMWRGGEKSLSAVCLHHADPAGISLFLCNRSLHTIFQTCTCEGRATTLQQVQTGLLGCGKTTV